jgi:hypothetical protein
MSADDASQKLTGGTVVFPTLKELRLASLHCSDQTVAAILAHCTQLRTMVRANAHQRASLFWLTRWALAALG